MPKVTILSGRRSGESLDLAPGEHQIGTGSAAAIQLRDKDVSFKHAKLVVDGEAVFLEDLKSKSGTFVNGERVDARVALRDQDTVSVGQAELRIECASAAPAAQAPAPVAAPPAAPAEPKAEKAEPKETKAEAKARAKAEAEAAKAQADAAEAAKAPEPAPAEVVELPADPELLKAMVIDLRRSLKEKTQEAEALNAAIEGGAAGDMGSMGYAPSVQDDLETRNLELQQIADEKAAIVLEKDEELRELTRQVSVLERRLSESKTAEERERDSMAGEVLRRDERVAEANTEVDTAKAEVARFEQVNSELLLETEELKEKLAAAQYRLEQEAAGRGSLVRERVAELQKDVERLEQSNAEMRTLVEAYEEKIDELDERVEELEGENEALQTVVTETRAELARSKTERETAVKTLRQKLKRLEDKTEELAGDRARAKAAGSRADAELQDQPT